MRIALFKSRFQRGWIFVVAAVLVCSAGAWGASRLSVSEYKAQATLYFSLDVNKSATDLNQGSTYTQSQMVSFAQIATAPIVLESVISDLKLQTTPAELGNQVKVTNPVNTVILQINATSVSPSEAANIANAVAFHLGGTVEKLGPKDDKGNSTISVSTLQTAAVPKSASSPNTKLNVAAGGILGMLLGVLGLLLWRNFDKRIHDEAELAQLSDPPVLGAVERNVVGDPPFFLLDPSSPQAEQYRRLREAMRSVAGRDGQLGVVVSSVIPSGGEPNVLWNLAFAFAEMGTQVLIIDANLNRDGKPSGERAQKGLAQLVAGEISWEDAVTRSDSPLVDFLPSGGPTANAAKLISSTEMSELVKRRMDDYPIILIAAASVSIAADTSVLEAMTGHAVLVVTAGVTNKAQLKQSLQMLERTGVTPMGVVLASDSRGRKGNHRWGTKRHLGD